jgi:hypothetical protein
MNAAITGLSTNGDMSNSAIVGNAVEIAELAHAAYQQRVTLHRWNTGADTLRDTEDDLCRSHGI